MAQPHCDYKCQHCNTTNIIIGDSPAKFKCIGCGIWSMSNPHQMEAETTVPGLMEEAANTFRERNKVYGDNYKNVGKVMMAMFPQGIDLRSAEDFNKWHLFELMVVKMTRFANSNLTHKDSIHDLGVYSFMVEREVK